MIIPILAITTLFLSLLLFIYLATYSLPTPTKKRRALPQSLTRLEVRGGKHHQPVKIFENLTIIALWWLSLPLFTLIFLEDFSQDVKYIGLWLFFVLCFGTWWWWRKGSFKSGYVISSEDK